jgi:translation initiation factor IF-2
MELIEILGIEVKSHQSVLTPRQVDQIRVEMGLKEPDPELAGEEVATVPASETASEEPEIDPELPISATPAAAVEVPPVIEPPPEPVQTPEPEVPTVPSVDVFAAIVVKDLATLLDKKPNLLIAQLMKMNIFAGINQTITQDIAKKLAEHFGFEVRTEKPKPPAPLAPPVEEPVPGADIPPVETPAAAKPKKKGKEFKSTTSDEVDSGAKTRPPVVTFMGHVDHGKTSLLDRIRKANVVSGEAGGITQHIGAYTVEANGQAITFLDTPGHAAFTAMRARGANLTDIAIIVVSAEEGIKPQTREAIQHAQAAGVALMVAANKIDLPNANIDKVKRELQQEGLTTEDWGGDVILCPVSAVTGQGIDELLEMIKLQAEILELRARPNGPAEGRVIEAQMVPGEGPTASVLVTAGNLKRGDAVVCGNEWGKIKALIDHNGQRVENAGPSHAVRILGLSGVPSPGDRLEVAKTDREARAISAERLASHRLDNLQEPARKTTLDDLYGTAKEAEREEQCLIIKCDVKGSLEALVASLREIKSDKVALKIVASGIGGINENDVLLAKASNALLVGFNVSQDNAASRTAKREGVDVRNYEIIYELLDDVRDSMTGLLKPLLRERVTGHAEIRVIFKLNKGGNVAGCMVVDGRIRARGKARVLRGKEAIWQGNLASLKRFQDEVSEVGNGQECGIRLENFNNFEAGDLIEIYETDSVKQEL